MNACFRPRIWNLLFCLGLGFFSATVGANPPSPEPQRIVVWGKALSGGDRGFEAQVREFERRHPEYRISAVGLGAGRMDPQKLMTAIVGGAPPDVIFQDRFTISDWAQRGAFRPLDDLIARDRALPLSPRPEDYYPAAWQEATYQERLFAIPTAADVRYLYFNEEVLRAEAEQIRKAGLNPSQPPQTWSEILAFSRVLTRFHPDGRLKRAGFIPNFGDSWLYLYAFQNNASFLSPDGRTCTLASEPVREALEFMRQAYAIVGGYAEAQRFQSTFRSGENDPFALGQVVMKVDGDWNLHGLVRYNPKLQFGVAPAPVPDDRFMRRGRFAAEPDRFITWSGGHSWAIPRGARQVEGAWKFIQWITSEEGRLLSLRTDAEDYRRRGRVFIPPLQAHRRTTEVVYREMLSADPRYRRAMELHLELMKVSRSRPPTFAGQVLWDAHVRATERACLGIVSPEQALAEGQQTVQRNLDEVFGMDQFPVIDLRVPSWLGVGAAVLGAILLISATRRQRMGRLARTENRWGYLLIAPWMVGFFVFTLGPMAASLFFSFTQYDVLNEARWVGLKNFSDAVTYDSANLTKAFTNVLYLGGIGVPLGLVTGLAIAMLLNSAVRGMRFYRTLFYLPSIVPGVASTILWMWILSPDPNRGLVNAAWASTITPWFGVAPPGWFTVEPWAKPTLIVMGLWGAGSGMILWLAGLKGISKSLYEAAVTDGASPWRQFTSVTLPMLSPIIFFNTVMGFIGALQTFDQVYVITGGSGSGPNDSLLTPVMHLFRNGFGYFRMGYASALAWVLFLIIVALTWVQFKLAPRWVYTEVEK